MKAKTPAQVLAAEAGGRKLSERWGSMLDIASAAYNRAKATGTTIKDVVSVKSQFNAYNSAMPPGTAALTAMAERALSYVEQNGPVHAGTYYATPATVGNLPAGLVEVPGASPIHTVFQDPQNRPIVTAVGTKRVNASLLPEVAPTPTARPTQVASLAPQAPQAATAPTAPTRGLQMTPEDMQSNVGQQALRNYVESVAKATSPQYQMAAAPAMAAEPGIQSAIDRALAERLAAVAPAPAKKSTALPGLPGLDTFAKAPAAAAPKTSRIGSVDNAVAPERFGPAAAPKTSRPAGPSVQDAINRTSPRNTVMAPAAKAGPWTGAMSAVDRALAERLSQPTYTDTRAPAASQFGPNSRARAAAAQIDIANELARLDTVAKSRAAVQSALPGAPAAVAPAPQGVAMNPVSISLPGDAMLADSMAGNIDAMQYQANKPAPSISPPNPGSVRGLPSAASKRAANLAQYQRGTIPQANVLSERNKQLKESAARYAAFESERAKSFSGMPAPSSLRETQRALDPSYAAFEAERAKSFSALSAPNAGVTVPSLSRRGTSPANYATPAASLRQPAGTPFSSVGAGLKASPNVASPPNAGSLRGQPVGAIPSKLGGITMSNPNFSAPSVAPRPTAAPRPSAATLAANLGQYRRGTVPGSSLPASAPTPTARPSTPAARPAAPVAAPAPERFGVPAPAAPSTTYAPGTKPSNPSQLGGITMSNPAGLIGDQLPSWATPVPGLNLITEDQIAPTVMPTVQISPPTVHQTPTSVPSRPSAPPMAKAVDVYSGRATVGMDNTGNNTITRNPDGTTSVTNKYGATTTTMQDGKQAAGGGIFGMPGLPGAKPTSALSKPSSLSTTGAPKTVKDALGKIAAPKNVATVAGGALGFALGGVPGAIGVGALANKLANRMTMGRFPGAPAAPAGSKNLNGFGNRQSDRDHAYGISPGAAAAIDRGEGGLY